MHTYVISFSYEKPFTRYQSHREMVNGTSVIYAENIETALKKVSEAEKKTNILITFIYKEN